MINPTEDELLQSYEHLSAKFPTRGKTYMRLKIKEQNPNWHLSMKVFAFDY
jgi:hypothetical protein